MRAPRLRPGIASDRAMAETAWSVITAPLWPGSRQPVCPIFCCPTCFFLPQGAIQDGLGVHDKHNSIALRAFRDVFLPWHGKIISRAATCKAKKPISHTIVDVVLCRQLDRTCCPNPTTKGTGWWVPGVAVQAGDTVVAC